MNTASSRTGSRSGCVVFYVCSCWLDQLTSARFGVVSTGQASRESLHDLRHTDAIAIITITIK